MIFKQMYEYPQLEQVTDPSTGKRHYNYNEYRNMASVTTILSETGDKTALLKWKERVGEDKAAQESKQATGLGKLMHTHLENYVLGIERPGGNNFVHKMAKEMADIIINKGLVNVSECWGQEFSVYFPKLYAGTVDAFGLHDNVPAIMDYKTSKKIKKIEYVESYFCQLCAYALAHNELYGTNIRKGVIFMATRPVIETKTPADFKEYIIEGNEFDKYVDMWMRRLEEYYKLT